MFAAIPGLAVLLLAAPYDFTPHYLADPAVESAYRTFKDGKLRQADAELEAWLAEAAPGETRDALTFLRADILARRAKKAGRQRGKPFMAARLELLATLQEHPEWAGPVHHALGEAAQARGDAAQALDHYARVPEGSAEYVDASLAAARLLAAKGRGERALMLLGDVERAGVTRWNRERLRLLRGEVLGRTGRKAEAVSLLMDIWVDDPTSALGRAAERELRKLKAAPGPSDRLVLAFAGVRKGSRKELLRDLAKARRQNRRASKGAVLFARGVVDSVEERRRPRAVKRFRAAARDRSPFVRGYARYRLAETLSEMGQEEAARQELEKLARDLPDHPMAPQALIEVARAAQARGRTAAADALYAQLARRYAAHPKRVEYLWQVAWGHWVAGRHRRAAELFDRIARDDGRVRHLGQATWGERARYWRARAAYATGDTGEALTLWTELVEGHPLSYYSHQAFNRVCEISRERCAALRQRAPVDPHELTSPLDLSSLTVARSGALDTAVALIRLGLFGMARSELAARGRAGQLDSGGLSLLVSVGLRNKRFTEGEAPRWRGSLPGYPDGAGRQLWRLAYPLPFWNSVRTWAERWELSPWLVIALIRHESGYNPKARSHASAIGLMQLLVATARGVARSIEGEERPSSRTLRDPDVNIRLGTRFLRELLRLFQDNEALALAAYNAGPGRARKWWQAFVDAGRKETDEFVEEIPYKETHSYVKSVLASYGVYRYLYGPPEDTEHRTIPLERALPEALGPYFSRGEGG